ncbi:MAG: hypothetical protein M0D57_09985 [Sphingobacteriales bacterium JAD_PAG50586_3]|nr:MAG: hypothetical protein M0D57_09985 [Sphingobacteriales bacterium JAD_PAG50586_3]
MLIPIGIIIYNIVELRKPPVVIPLGDNNPLAPPQPNDGAPTLPQP